MNVRFKRFKKFSKLLYNLNLGQTQYKNNRKTLNRNSSFKKDNCSYNLINPEIEYVTKLNFFIPKSPSIENKKTSNSVENKILENKLENKRKELENKISKRKQNIKTLNEDLSKIISEIDNLKLDFEVLQNNKTCSMIEKNIKKNIALNSFISPKRERNNLPLISNKTNIQEKYRIESILSKHKKEMKSKKNFDIMKLAQLKSQKNMLIKKIKLYEIQLATFREEKNEIKNELLSHYHNILYEGKDIRKEGLTWVIQAIWNLKSEILPSYFPKYLDEISIEFLLDYSKNNIKLKDLYKLLQKITSKINENKNNLNNNETIEPDTTSKETEYEENKDKSIKWKFNTIRDKIVKKNTFNNDYFYIRNKLLITRKDSLDSKKENEINKNELKSDITCNKVIFNKTRKEIYNLYNTKKIIEKKIYKLKNEIKNMIETELSRLNNLFYKERQKNKYNIDKYKIISAVLGEDNARNDINKHINESKNYLNILKDLSQENN